MNLLEILQSRVGGLPDGDYMQGLKAIIQHIEVAEKNFNRGKDSGDETAFTDAIYRTNQAFEGSLKEAYRVLAAKDPAKESPHVIEGHFRHHKVLRDRVLAQLTNYRREWRNPSTHDHLLDFDEDEALLAIVTVSVFAVVLVDQITERISYHKAKKVAAESPSPSPEPEPLIELVANLLEQFVLQFNQTHPDKTDFREAEIVGALDGFLSAAAPELRTNEGINFFERRSGADFMIKSPENEQLILEIKRGRPANAHREKAIQQVLYYMELTGIVQAILFSYGGRPNKGTVIRNEIKIANKHLLVLSTD